MRKVLGAGIAVMAVGMLWVGSAMAVGTSDVRPQAQEGTGATLPPQENSPITIPLGKGSSTWEKFFDDFKWGESAGYERKAKDDPRPWAPFCPVDVDKDTGKIKLDKHGDSTINPAARYGAWGLRSAENPSYFSKAELYYFREPFYFSVKLLPVGDPTKGGARFDDVIVFFNSYSVRDQGEETMIREGFVVNREGRALAAFDSVYGVGYTADGIHSSVRGTDMKSYRMLDPESAEVKTRWDFLLNLFLDPTPSGAF